MLKSCSTSAISSLYGATFSQVTAIITILFIIGTRQVSMAGGVSQCVRCDSWQDTKGPGGTSCEKKPPLPTPCSTMSSSAGPMSCIKSIDFGANGAIIRVLRDCSLIQRESGCTESTDPEIAPGTPAKSCMWKCDSDNCNSAHGFRYRYDVLIVCGLLIKLLVVASPA